MDYNYNLILDEFKKIVNTSTAACYGLISITSIITCILVIADLLPGNALIALIGFVPFSILLIVLSYYSHKKIKTLDKKLQISAATRNAKKVMSTLVKDYPDTYASDCRTKMQYLTKNGIDVSEALKCLNNNVEAYNKLAAEFVQECDAIEDDLYSLMQTDTLPDYASKAHSLRLKSTALGITKLADTSFFLETVANSGSLELVEYNWKKLSFELDEAYGSLDKYLKTLNSNNAVTITKWGNQLNDAFDALEVYDTSKARTILNELVSCNINPGITDLLDNIITNVDEVIAK